MLARKMTHDVMWYHGLCPAVLFEWVFVAIPDQKCGLY